MESNSNIVKYNSSFVNTDIFSNTQNMYKDSVEVF